MKKVILVFCLVSGYLAQAQLPEDVLKYSYMPQQGTARNVAIGGAMGSLGGDINALYVNPAGIGMYKTREIVLSPGIIFNSNKINFRETNSTSKKSAFGLGTSGVVIGFNSRGSKWTNQTISFAITQTANYNNTYSYRGTNDQSSYSELFAEQFSKSGLNIEDALNEPRFAFGTAPALYTYLVDTFKNANGGIDIKGLPEFLLQKGVALNQQKTVTTSGGIYELALGYAANMDDNFYIGASIGIPIVNYKRLTNFREADPSADATNNFNFFELNDYLSTKGIGVNAKVGLIFKPAEYLRLGLAVHTPTFYSLTDRQSADIKADTEGYEGVRTANSAIFTGDQEGKTLYTATTPWKAVLSGSYVIREVSDTRKQKGFITADVEYVPYSSSRFNADGSLISSADQQYYSDLKQVIKTYYKSGINFRLGGELKFNTIMCRLGGAYYSNPYRQAAIKSNIKQISGGLGYRNHGMFVDLTYAHSFYKDVNFPYRLTDKANTFADQKNSLGNVLMTVGFKF